MNSINEIIKEIEFAKSIARDDTINCRKFLLNYESHLIKGSSYTNTDISIPAWKIVKENRSTIIIKYGHIVNIKPSGLAVMEYRQRKKFEI